MWNSKEFLLCLVLVSKFCSFWNQGDKEISERHCICHFSAIYRKRFNLKKTEIENFPFIVLKQIILCLRGGSFFECLSFSESLLKRFSKNFQEILTVWCYNLPIKVFGRKNSILGIFLNNFFYSSFYCLSGWLMSIMIFINQ